MWIYEEVFLLANEISVVYYLLAARTELQSYVLLTL
jgi:hypothetical protein